MLIEEIQNIKSSKKDLRDFGIAVGIVLIALGSILYWFGKGSWPFILIPGILLTTAGMLCPGILKPLQKVWMTFAVIMGWFMTRLILGILFYVVFTSTRLIGRLFGKQFLETGKNTQDSYWNYRDTEKVKNTDCERQF